MGSGIPLDVCSEIMRFLGDLLQPDFPFKEATWEPLIHILVLNILKSTNSATIEWLQSVCNDARCNQLLADVAQKSKCDHFARLITSMNSHDILLNLCSTKCPMSGMKRV